MPEGHLIRIAADKQTALLGGKRLRVGSPQGRFTGTGEVDGRTLRRVEGVGKLLFYHFAGGRLVYVHLGRLGAFRYHGVDPPEPTPGTRMRLTRPEATVDLAGPIACRLVTADERAGLVAKLGPDPLHPDFDDARDREIVYDKVSKSRRAIGALLLDQALFAGTGNIFRAEALFRTGVHPAVPGNEIGRGRFDAVWDDLVLLLRRATKAGKIVGVDRADVDKPPARLGRGERFLIYKRDACRRCGTPAQTLKLGGRPIWFCPNHQKR